MKLLQAAKEVEIRTGIKTIFLFLMVCSMSANFILAVMALQVKNTHRETLVPPTINKTFWVDGEKVSTEYLEQMGKFIADLALSSTPLNCDTQKTLLLKYVSPASYSSIRTQLDANCKIIKDLRMALYFNITDVITQEGTNQIVFRGVMNRWLGDKKLGNKATAYRVAFVYAGGKIMLKGIDEVDARTGNVFDEAAVIKTPDDEIRTKQMIEEGEMLERSVPTSTATSAAGTSTSSN
jgi:conjugal transfer pilus assembly protein TraE